MIEKFITCTKGAVFDTLNKQPGKKRRRLLLTYGDKEFSVDNLEDYENEFYLGAKLDLENAKKLIEFLKECITQSDN